MSTQKIDSQIAELEQKLKELKLKELKGEYQKKMEAGKSKREPWWSYWATPVIMTIVWWAMLIKAGGAPSPIFTLGVPAIILSRAWLMRDEGAVVIR